VTPDLCAIGRKCREEVGNVWTETGHDEINIKKERRICGEKCGDLRFFENLDCKFFFASFKKESL